MILEYPSLLTQPFINRIEKRCFSLDKILGKISVLEKTYVIILCPANPYLNNYYNDDVL